jgi:hypothetical protein
MTFREVDCVSELNHSTQKVRARTEALDDAGNLLSARPSPPKIISCGRFAGRFGIFDDPDFRVRLRGWSAIRACRMLRIVV